VNLLLVGHRGSGKTTVGQLVARRLGWRFIDLDDYIVKHSGRSIAQIFESQGEAGFRLMERRALESLKKARNHVIALGGGTVMDPDNRALAKKLGKIVWLKAPAAVLWSRISQDPHTARTRPSLTGTGGLSEVETVLAQREPIYRETASHTIDTLSLTPRDIAEAVEMWLAANDADTF